MIVDDCCCIRTHFRDGRRDDGVDRMSAVLRGELAPIRRMVEVQDGKEALLRRFAHSSHDMENCPALSPRGGLSPLGRPYVGDLCHFIQAQFRACR